MKHLQWFMHHVRLLSHHLLFIFILILTVGLFTTDHIHIDRIQFTHEDGDSISNYLFFIR